MTGTDRVLLTTTSFQDIPGEHHRILEEAGLELVRARGPLPEERMLELVGDVDALLCGDDAITRAVIERALPRLRVISKYGIGLDKIDVDAATELGIPLTFCPGVNHTTVAEHTFGLLLALFRKLVTECNHVMSGEWTRLTGHELLGKTIGIVGLGRIGREVAVRARAFGMPVIAFDPHWDDRFATEHEVRRMDDVAELVGQADVVTLHVGLSPETRGLFDAAMLRRMRPEAVLLNTARGELVDTDAIVVALREGRLAGYGADVLDVEPPPSDHPLFGCSNVVLTPHIGSRTFESVGRQAKMAAQNLVHVLRGEAPLAQANSVGS